MHHYAFVIHIRTDIISHYHGWYVHRQGATGWNSASPRHNIGNNDGQTKMFVTESIPQMGVDAQWEPVMDYGEVCKYEGIDWIAEGK